MHLGQEDLIDADVGAGSAAWPAARAARTIMPSLTRARIIIVTMALPTDLIHAAQEDAARAAGLARIGEWKKLIGERPLVAIGGLTVERALLCLRAGADSAAVVGDIVNSGDPIAQAKTWIAATRPADDPP